jgi:O-antigen/teichoic acid export membrane protein
MIVNTLVSVALKFAHAALGFATIHALVALWGQDLYGTWVTFTSVALYLTMFDLGIGYGIRNKVAEAWGTNQLAGVQDTVRLGMVLYALAAAAGTAVAAVVTFTVSPFRHHPAAALVLWSSCALSFFLSLHNIVLQAIGRFQAIAVLSLITPLTWYVFVLTRQSEQAMTLETAAIAYAASMLLQALVIAWISQRSCHFRFFGRLRIDFARVRALVGTGLKFFILQLSALALTSSGNFLVYAHLGGSSTAQYDAANKVFSMFTFGFSVLIGIAWTEISKAKSRNDHQRLSRVFLLLHGVALGLTAVAVACALGSEPLTRALTRVTVSPAQTLPFAVMIGVQTLAYSSAVFLNAYERLRTQIISALLSIPLFFAVAIALLKSGYGIEVIPFATAVSLLPALATCFVTARRLIASERMHGPQRQGPWSQAGAPR